ncbi:hypothetical protein [Martelella soudanensis]|uniref:hypothetical protein n=1 Tax=unclassified Martelella TaxID=2629616 RepID=UPI0015DDA108|nr:MULTISPECIES: hypothetical protein [unclassified Martelella]
MPQESKAAIPTQDQKNAGDIFISVEMSRSKWVIGVHTPLAEKIALHTLTCGDVDALLTLIDRAHGNAARRMSLYPCRIQE